MKRTALVFTISFLFTALVKAQSKSSENRLTFSEWAGYYSNGSSTTNLGAGETTEAIGHSIGLLAFWTAPYKDYDKDDLVLGWNFNVGGGWNLAKSKVARYNADIGFWSSKLISKNVEVGTQYSFLGIYCYQNISFFGSSFQAAVRVANVQATYSREGEGVFTGWLKPQYPTSYTNALGAKYFIGNKFFVGGKFTKYRWNKEFAIVAGLTSL